uniref:BED-type domain-containing protein n=1 Tax=Arundo donax TaxID=35708 RepID=A0A0A9GNR2_ARUDO
MMPPPSTTAADCLGSNLPELLNTGDALERYQQVAQKLESLIAKDGKDVEIQSIIAEVPDILLRCVSRDEAALAVAQKVIYSDEEKKFNIEIIFGLIRSELVNLGEYNVHLAKLIDGGRNKVATEFAMSLVQTLITQDSVSISELYNVVDALSKLARRPGSPESMQQLIEIARNNANTPTGFVVGKDEKVKLSKDKKVLSIRATREESTANEITLVDPNQYSSVEIAPNKANILSKILSVTVRTIQKDAEDKKASFNPGPYFRLFITWLYDLTTSDAHHDGSNFQILTAFANTFHVLQPLRVPAWSFAWLELVSHRTFMPRLLMWNSQKGWPFFQRLLVDLFKFMEPYLRNAELPDPVNLLYKGTMRVLLVLLHDFPEFLYDYHFSFCDVILSAFPRNMRLPHPSTPNLKIDLLAEISIAPRIMSDVDGALKSKQMKTEIDEYLKRPEGSSFLSDLKQKLLLPQNEEIVAGTRYNVPLINSLVLYVGMQAVQQLQHNKANASASVQQINHTPPMDMFQIETATEVFRNLMTSLDTEGRYLLLNAIANQLRYPNNHTHYFSILYLFAEATQLQMATPSSSRLEASNATGASGPLVAASGNEEDMDVVDVSDGEEDEEVGEAGTAAGSKRKLTSAVWRDFDRVCIDGVWKAKCNHCKKKLSGISRNGTSHLKTHLRTCIYNKKRPGIKIQSNLRFATTEKGTVAVENYVFDQDVARRALFSMIILHEYPLSIVNHHGFRKFVSALQPLFRMGTRNTIRRDILSFYEGEKRKARIFLQRTNCRVAITTDLWTADNQKRGFMAVTGHFIDDSWMLKSCILRFMYVPCSHTGEVICDALYKCLQSWDLDRRISTVTLDNCSTNDNMIGLMETRLGASNMLLKGKWLHMRCCAHILNLIVKDGMEVIGTAVAHIRDSVAYWVATPKRYEKFEKTALDENVELEKKLHLDCKTRWNSTYIMLRIALPYRKVFERLDELDRNYVCPPEDDWIFATTVCEKLELFYDLTGLFSGTKYVTANLFFPKVCEIKLKINSWGHDENETIRKMSAAMIAKYDKYWADIHGLMAVAVILDPRLKMTMLHTCYIALFGEQAAERYVTESHELLIGLMKYYHVKEQDYVGTSSSGASSSVNAAAVLSIFKTLAANKKTTSYVKSKNELDRYLEDETLPHDENDYFDVLGWWKLEGT